MRLVVHYAASRTPQPSLTYPRSGPMFELRSDIKTAMRSFMRAPGTSALIVMTLAFAIGAATIGFAFADLALFRGLPVDDESKVITVKVDDTHGSMGGAHRVSAPDFLDYQARTRTLHSLAAFRYGRAALISNGQSQTLDVVYTTAAVFAAMGQRAFAGRVFMPGDDRPGAPKVAVVAHRYWKSDMQSRPDVIGRTIQLGRDHYTIVGIASPDMEFGNLGEVVMWLPVTLETSTSPRDARNLRFLARLNDGVTFEQARAEMSAIGAALAAEYPATNTGWNVTVVPVSDLIGGDGFWVVIALFTLSVGLLIAVATANVSNLVMVRTLARARELAVRTALGARKGRLIRQLLTEGMLLSLFAAIVSVPLAWSALRGIQLYSAEQVFQQLAIDMHEIGFVALLALICPVMFSLSPVRSLSRADLRQVLAAGGSRGATSPGRGRGVLVVVQVALAVILLTVSSLALRSIRQMYAQPLGFDSSRLLVFGLELNDVQYPSIEQARAAASATRDALQATPGVESIDMVTSLPISGDQAPQMLTIDGAVASAQDARPAAVITGASHSLNRTMGLRMLAGEWWSETARDAVVISAEAARRYFGGVDRAVGHRVSLLQGDRTLDARVIGVSSDIANTDRSQQPPPRVFVPLDPSTRRLSFIVRAANPGALTPSVRSSVATNAASIPIDYLSTWDDELAREASSDFVIIGMLSGFALLALVLAASGLFGVVSYTVAQRTSEFGTRMALGASAIDVVNLVACDSAKLLVIGLSIGLAGGVGVGFMIRTLLYGLSPLDPLTLASVIALLAAVTVSATALPAWRASRIDPVIALRAD
ncbi:MAG: ADOP family duplicated permease [Cyanobacteria bacterium]|nr:ADOP family duplicated permease [Cyanobacteriota bacterium]